MIQNIRATSLSVYLNGYLPYCFLDFVVFCCHFLVILRNCLDLRKKNVSFDFQHVK